MKQTTTVNTEKIYITQHITKTLLYTLYKNTSSIMYALVFLIMLTAQISPSNVLYLVKMVCVLSIAIILYEKQYKAFTKLQLMIPVSMLLLITINFIWYKLFKHNNSEYIDAYRNYFNFNLSVLYSLPIFLCCITNKPITNNKYINILIIIPITYALVSLYLKYIHNMERIAIGNLWSTKYAYILTIIGILIHQLILQATRTLNSYICIFISFMCIFISIILSGTRSAIILYPILTLIMLTINLYKHKKALICTIIYLLISTTILGFMFKDAALQRFNDINQDINMYTQGNSHTSIGARFAMLEIGIKSFLEKPFGQSLESRNDAGFKSSATNKLTSGANEHLKTHLHNELVDALSTKGVIGALSILSLYACLFYVALKTRNISLLLISFAIVIYGLIDVLCINISVPIIMLFCIVVSYKININYKI